MINSNAEIQTEMWKERVKKDVKKRVAAFMGTKRRRKGNTERHRESYILDTLTVSVFREKKQA